MPNICKQCQFAIFLRTCLLGLLWCGSAGCSPSEVRIQPFPVRAIDADEVYRRSREAFDQAILYKPDEAHTDPLTAVLAPLVVSEMRSTTAEPAKLSGLGAVFRGSDGVWRVDDTQAVVYAEVGTSFVGGGVRSQTVMAWCHEVALPEGAVEVVCRGLRVTSDADGYPLAWEVLDPKWRGDIIYVSESVESLAQDQYGAALPGREHSVERSADDARRTVVPRILSDGPVPMGPYVYLEGTRGEVSTVLCRCMDSQVNEFTETRVYQVMPLAALGAIGRSLKGENVSLTTRLRWPDGIE